MAVAARGLGALEIASRPAPAEVVVVLLAERGGGHACVGPVGDGWEGGVAWVRACGRDDVRVG